MQEDSDSKHTIMFCLEEGKDEFMFKASVALKGKLVWARPTLTVVGPLRRV